MSKFHLPGEIVEFRPEPDKPVVYRLRVPTKGESMRWRREIGAAGGRYHTPRQMVAALRRALQRVMEPGEARDFHDAALAEADAAITLGNESELVRLVEPTEVLVAALDPTYAALIADNGNYGQVAGYITLRDIVVGWDGLPRPYARDGKVTSEAAMAAVPDLHMLMLANEMAALMSPSEDEAKNSGSPSLSSNDGETSMPSTSAAETPST